MLFFTIKHCQIFTLTKGHGAGVTVGKCICMEMFYFFFKFDLTFFPPYSLSFPPFSFAFSCALPMLGHLSRTWLVLTGLHYEGTTVNWKFLVKKFDHFFSYLEAFLYMLESSCSYIYYPHTTILNGTGTGRLLVLILRWGSCKMCWTAIKHSYRRWKDMKGATFPRVTTISAWIALGARHFLCKYWITTC